MLLGATLLAVAPAPGPAAEAAAPTCQGKRATKVGSPGQAVLRGTARRDVMVTNGSARAYGGAGNDLICVTRRATATRVFDGPGHDVVDARGAAGPISADVDGGNDVIRGSRYADRVRPHPSSVANPGGADSLFLGAGNDEVEWSTSSGDDEVQLGPGDDAIAYAMTRSGPVLDVFGGDGRDDLTLGGRPGTWSVDLGAGRVRGRSSVLARLGQFERYDLYELGSKDWDGGAGPTQVTVVGSAGRDVVDLGQGNPVVYDTDYAYVDRSVSAHLGAGDDRLLWRANDAGVAWGGPGDDELVVRGHDQLRGDGDLTTREFVSTYAYDDVTYRQVFDLAGWEAVLVEEFRAASLRGDGGANRLGALSPTSYPTPVTVVGRGGDDVLVGSSRDDVLLGGDGTDRADGRAGRDRCDAETTTGCETS